MLERMWGNCNPCTLWCDCIMVQPLWKTAWRCLKILKTEQPCDPAVLLLSMYPKELKAVSGRDYLHFHVLSSIILNSQETDATRCSSMDDWINKLWSIHTMECYSAWKRKDSVTCYNMEEPWGHHAERHTLVTERQILCDSTYMRYLK